MLKGDQEPESHLRRLPPKVIPDMQDWQERSGSFDGPAYGRIMGVGEIADPRPIDQGRAGEGQ